MENKFKKRKKEKKKSWDMGELICDMGK